METYFPFLCYFFFGLSLFQYPFVFNRHDLDKFWEHASPMKLVCIKDHPQFHEFIEDYFEKHEYAKLKLWSRSDSHNSYFAPRELVKAKLP